MGLTTSWLPEAMTLHRSLQTWAKLSPSAVNPWLWGLHLVKERAACLPAFPPGDSLKRPNMHFTAEFFLIAACPQERWRQKYKPKCAEEPVAQKVVLDAVLCWNVDTGVKFIRSQPRAAVEQVSPVVWGCLSLCRGVCWWPRLVLWALCYWVFYTAL